MSDPNGPRENHLKHNQLTIAGHPHGGLRSTSARHVMKGARNVVMRDSTFFVAQKIEVHEHGGHDDTLLDTLEGLLSFILANQTVLDIKKELEDLKAKLEAIRSILQQYQKHDSLHALRNRIEIFCSAITTQLNSIEDMQKNSPLAPGAEGAKGADTMLKAMRNINSLCDAFQMDTQLNIEEMVGDILQRLNSGSIEKLNHEMTSYKTRQSSYGDPTGCMQGTRVKVLEKLDTWASNPNSSKVYWMVGMAGIGKSTIAHTFCEKLEAKNILGGSFFASRASEKTRNARLIIPVIAHALARASPRIKVEVVKAIEDDPTLAEPTYIKINEQFKRLVYNPLQTTVGVVDKVVVIDAVDECANLEVVASFIKLVLEWAPKIPLKIFVASRDEYRIRNAFRSTSDSIRGYFHLHDIEKDVVQNDIRIYLRGSLARIKDDDLSGLVASSGTLFIYAATAVRYITIGGEDYKPRLSAMLTHGQRSINKFETEIDSLYVHVLKKVCEDKEPDEVDDMRNVLSMTLFLRNPLSMEAITSLSPESNARLYLSWLTSVIHIPDQPGAVVAPFHASFPDFITNPDRCSPKRCPSFRSLVA
ncbi:hypothetical protein K443DRAFT_14994 [Laccaria amethystina LaAM-08-1]|uniref:Nephrocystin 3-like N-terminal domain-containing protein n=1 Tax=Laccaria amethystina LaAM-08-1 TaxID=1095629 RepID=A0A0C9X2E6_9AGAR|nr:hypothetical protein K443DRAFT_14994 [Laccaria amethystina LaAM-08-1]